MAATIVLSDLAASTKALLQAFLCACGRVLCAAVIINEHLAISKDKIVLCNQARKEKQARDS
jgi:hypothetical protein